MAIDDAWPETPIESAILTSASESGESATGCSGWAGLYHRQNGNGELV